MSSAEKKIPEVEQCTILSQLRQMPKGLASSSSHPILPPSEYYRSRPRRSQESSAAFSNMTSQVKAVQTFGKKKTATAVAHAKEGRGLIRINGSPIHLIRPEILRFKVYEAVLVAGEDSFKEVDIRVRVKGGGHTSQVYAIRQAIAKALVAYYAKYIDAYSSLELKKKLIAYDRTLLIADPRRMEPKKFGGAGARARRQKSYR